MGREDFDDSDEESMANSPSPVPTPKKRKPGPKNPRKSVEKVASAPRNKKVVNKKPPVVTLKPGGGGNNATALGGGYGSSGGSVATVDLSSGERVSPVKTAQNRRKQQVIYEEEEDTDEEDIGDEGVNLTSIMNKLASELQQRMKSKRKRLEDCFMSVKGAPNKILQTLNQHSDERQKILDIFHTKSQEIVQQANKVVEQQKTTEEQLTKMMLATQKHFDGIKNSLNTCITGLADTVAEFEKETKEMEGKQGNDCKSQLEQIQKELGQLQRKILMEGQQEEAQNIRSTFKI